MAFPFLSVLGLLPLVGVLLTCLSKPRAAKVLGLVTALVTLAYAAGLIAWSQGFEQILGEQVDWLPMIGSSYALNFDGLSLVMVALTVLLVPVVLIAEWRSDWSADHRLGQRGFVAMVLLVECFALFSFLSFDLLLFYIFFEATLIPMYFLIAGWGGQKGRQAGVKFLIFGLAGGLIMLFAVIGVIALSLGSGDISLNFADLSALQFASTPVTKLIFICFFIAFAMKAPMFPVHIWLPDAAEQSSAGTTALLVGVLDKLGTFAMIRVCLGVFPEESAWASPVIMIAALVSIFYGAFAAIGSRNLLRLLAYTSISHFGFIVLGIFAVTSASISGSIFYMVNHGLATGALFLAIGYLISRRGSASLDAYGGVAKIAPLAAGFTLVAGLASCALPGTSSFVSEFLVVAGVWSRHPVIAGVAVLGTVVAAVYILRTYQRLMTGEPSTEVSQAIDKDLNWRERIALIPLVLAFLVLGFWPQPALQVIEPTTQYYMSVAGATDPVSDLEEGGR
ncbi:MAG: NADH-quinone oxidoreductase subunit M [Propionibacteriaceae bacterium]|nr:NADH-quinone oxidoreductase subunit M [Propionibacteriaceae bacterium]